MAKKESEKTEEIVPRETPKFDFHLVVINPFDSYQKGQLITDETAINAIVEGGSVTNCNRIQRL